MTVMATNGRGFIPVPSLVVQEALQRYKLQVIGTAEDCREHLYAITAERRLQHPAVARITEAAQRKLAGSCTVS
jgi:LysR family transcriptional activator of nhaA